VDRRTVREFVNRLEADSEMANRAFVFCTFADTANTANVILVEWFSEMGKPEGVFGQRERNPSLTVPGAPAAQRIFGILQQLENKMGSIRIFVLMQQPQQPREPPSVLIAYRLVVGYHCRSSLPTG